MKKILLFIAVSLCAMMSQAQQTENRVALVIGNSAYKTSPLKNPVNDATDMAARLKGFGFTVIERNNLTTKQIGSTLREFRSKLTPGSVALVFYAGHGVTIKGKNYLPAVDAEINGEEDVPNQSLGTEQIMDVLAEAKTRLNLVFLDACRDNPYARSFRSTSRGLSRESAPSGTLISFATKPGSVAADGTGRNGLYTSVLLEQIKNSGQPIEQVLKKVVTGVRTASKNQQEPWMEGSIEGDFCFGGCGQTAVSQVPAEPTESQKEDNFWNDAKAAGNKEAFEAYLKKYPNGNYAALANANMKRLKSTETLPAPISPPTQVASQTTTNISTQNTSDQVSMRWRLASAFPRGLDIIFGASSHFAKGVSDRTDGKFVISVHPAGELAPTFKVLDVVREDSVEMGHILSNYYFNKDPAWSMGSSQLFGVNSSYTDSWLTSIEGRKDFSRFTETYDLINFPLGAISGNVKVANTNNNLSTVNGWWCRKPISNLADLKGLKVRVSLNESAIWSKLGVIPMSIPGGEIYPALEKGQIDCAQFFEPKLRRYLWSSIQT